RRTPPTPIGAPATRYYHTAVWTGTRMIIWGGYSNFIGYRNTGGLYDPATATSTSTSTNNAPEARYQHTAVWIGTRMVVWGGYGNSGYLNTGGRYDPTTD